MEITYLGHSCFKFKNKEGMIVVVDPFSPEFVGLALVKEIADVVVSSHDHEDHHNLEMVSGPVKRSSVFVIDREGEYEIGGVEISAIKTYHDKNEGADRGKNLVTVFRIDGVTLVHLGDLGHKLSDSQVERLGSVAVLMVPVGGYFSLDASEASDAIKQIQPSLVIPMHYKVPGMKDGFEMLGTLENFLDKNKYPLAGEAVHKLKVDASSLPDDTQVQTMNA